MPWFLKGAQQFVKGHFTAMRQRATSCGNPCLARVSSIVKTAS